MKHRARTPARLLVVSGVALLLGSLSNAERAVADDPDSIVLVDRSAETFFMINIGDDPRYGGRFVFIDAGDGIFWGAEAATVALEPNGSRTVTYDGSGSGSPDGLFDPATWLFRPGPTLNAQELELSGTIGADMESGSVVLETATETYELDDAPPTASPQGTLDNIINLIEGEDWEDLYNAFHPLSRPSTSQAAFADGMEAAFGAEGQVDHVDITDGPTQTRTGTGWYTASSQIALSMLSDGRIATYAATVELAFDDGWELSWLSDIEPDNTAPASHVLAMDSEIDLASVEVSYFASDVNSGVGVHEVELWWRYRADANASWGSWSLGPSEVLPAPLVFSFPSGPGLYEFYTVAIDNAGNEESAPGTADASTLHIDPPITERSSVSSAEVQADDASIEASVSGDGRYVAFESDATNLVSSDTNGMSDIFVRDRELGTTVRASVASSGTEANGSSQDPELSRDGRYVVFRSNATNLVSADTNAKFDIFRHDLNTGTTIRISVRSNGNQAGGHSDSPALTEDGAIATFRSNASNLIAGDTNGVQDIFVHVVNTGSTSRVSVDSSGAEANGASDAPSISNDGSIVAFDSMATNLVAGDTNSTRDVFVHDQLTGATSRISLAAGAVQANGHSFEPSLAGNGTKIAFDSDATNLVAGDLNGDQDVFVVTLSSGAIVRASVDSSGNESNGDAAEASLTEDGALVAFYSNGTNLVAGDTNGDGDIFVRALGANTIERWSVTDGGGQADGRSTNPMLSADGQSVVFNSFAVDLVAGDTNGFSDVYVRGPSAQ